MSILTKIFVVLVAVAALALTPMIVVNADSSMKIKQNFDDVNQRLAVAENAAKLAESIRSQSEVELTKTIEKLQADKAAQVKQLNDQMTQKQTSDLALIAANNKLDTLNAQFGDLSSALKDNQKIVANLEEEVNRRRDEVVGYREKFAGLNKEFQEVTTQADTLIQQVRLDKEKIADLIEQINILTSGAVAKGSTSGQATPIAEIPIRGLITNVKDIEGNIFVAVNIGTNDKVQEGMEFIIHQDEQFIGNMVIMKVDMNSSAGRVTLKKGDIVGDLQVLSSQK